MAERNVVRVVVGQAHFTGTPSELFPIFANFLEVIGSLFEPLSYVLLGDGAIYTLPPYALGTGVTKPSTGLFY